jgi:hypothetical protein
MSQSHNARLNEIKSCIIVILFQEQRAGNLQRRYFCCPATRKER